MERLIRKAEAARMLGVSYTTLWRMRTDPRLPKPRRLTYGGVVGFLESELDAYLKECPIADAEWGQRRIEPALKARGYRPADSP